MGGRLPPFATPLKGNAKLRSAFQLSEAKELIACYLKARS